MKIGILGAGSMGRILARNLGGLGYDVTFANSRGPDSLTSVAAETGATPVSVVDAVGAGEIVVPGPSDRFRRDVDNRGPVPTSR